MVSRKFDRASYLDAVQGWADAHGYLSFQRRVPDLTNEQLEGAWEAFGKWEDDGEYIDARDILNHPQDYEYDIWAEAWTNVFHYVVELMEYMTAEEFMARYGTGP